MAAASAGSLSGIGTLYAWEFDDENGTNFSITGLSTAYASEFDENTSTTLTSTQRMRVTSSPTGNVIVYDSINEIDPFGEIPTDGLQLHLDSVDSPINGQGTAQGQQNFTSSGTFTVPAGVTSIAVLCIGGGGGGGGSEDSDETGGGGGGGALAYVNNLSVTAGESLTVTVGSGGNGGGGGGNGSSGGSSSLARGGTTLVQANGGGGGQHRGSGGSGGTVSTGTGGSGGQGGQGANRNGSNAGGGGGAGGYSGAGGRGCDQDGSPSGASGSGGAGGGGGRNDGGGGVGVLGEGSSGSGGGTSNPGGLGSGGTNGSSGSGDGGNGGNYGGGGGGAQGSENDGGDGGNGYVRILWSTSSSRSYPSTLTTDQTSSSLTYIWDDISGNNRDATFIGNPTVVGNFINFDGTDDYAATDGTGTGSSSYLGIDGTGARTSIVFFKLDSNTITDQNRLLAWGVPGTTGGKWALELNTSNQINIGVSGGSRQTNTTYDFSQWTMIATTYPGGTGNTTNIRIWVNGIEQTDLGGTTQTVNTDTTDATGYVSIAAAILPSTPNGFVDGQFAKILIYNRELSDLEIKIIYRSILYRLLQ